MSKKNRKNKTIIPNSKNLPLTEYFAELPNRSNERKNVLVKIAKETGREECSVRRWMNGEALPPTQRCKTAIAKFFNVH